MKISFTVPKNEKSLILRDEKMKYVAFADFLSIPNVSRSVTTSIKMEDNNKRIKD